MCFKARCRNHCCCKAELVFSKQTYTSKGTRLQRSAIIMVLYVLPSPTFHQDVFPGLLSFECAAKSNITDYKTLQSLLVKLPRLLSLHLPQPAFFCPPPASLPVLSSFTGLCCATGCCGPTLVVLLESCPPGPPPGPSHLQ